ncbi:hypothetical protein E4U54_005895, partial [Claviceps lovelessii]
MQFTTLLVNVLLTSVVAAKNIWDDPDYCKNKQLEKRHLDVGDGSDDKQLDKRLRRSRTLCLACCHGTAMLCDSACRALYSGPGD